MKSMSSRQESTSVSSSSTARVDSLAASCSNDGAARSSALEEPQVKAPDDVKEPGYTMVESKS